MENQKITFRVQLFKGSNELCKELAILACESNADNEAIEYEELKEYFDIKKEMDAKVNEYIFCNFGDTFLLVSGFVKGTMNNLLLLEKQTS